MEYIASDGKKRKSKLLIRFKYLSTCINLLKPDLTFSGFWGVSRHMNYVFELMLAFSWSCPALGYGVYPFFYWWFLLILLVVLSLLFFGFGLSLFG